MADHDDLAGNGAGRFPRRSDPGRQDGRRDGARDHRQWGQPFCAPCTAFLGWADRYEAGDRPGRNLKDDTAWARALDCPVLLLDSARPPGELLQSVLDRLDQIAALA
ncbi:P-loop NTPase family protein [Mangrovicoccus ximenensis]|uniref:hypothetical protein n=1 Tax=Mangrovicoccus ximenensis TaxID=1911570 RepID=UPI000D3A7CE4|nr:hypothetical protein [Mangrovicoccus ximenensis]